MAEREHFTNGRCFAFAIGLAIVVAAFGAQIGGWNHSVSMGVGYGSGVVLMLLAAVLITKSYFSGQSQNTSSLPQTSGMIPGIPTLSALLGQNPITEFNSKQFFALAYYSPITAEVEKTMKEVAQRDYPNDREAFYAPIHWGWSDCVSTRRLVVHDLQKPAKGYGGDEFSWNYSHSRPEETL